MGATRIWGWSPPNFLVAEDTFAPGGEARALMVRECFHLLVLAQADVRVLR